MLHNLRIAISERFGTQLACAKAAGIHPVRLNRICLGWVEPTVIERERLAEAIATDAAWLFSTAWRIPVAPKRSDETASAAMVAVALET